MNKGWLCGAKCAINTSMAFMPNLVTLLVDATKLPALMPYAKGPGEDGTMV
jgi:hypothetical protein